MPNSSHLSARGSRTFAVYAAMILGTIAAFFRIREQGANLPAPAPAGETFGTRGIGGTSDALMHILLTLVVVILAARGLAWLFRRVGQPPVIGEVLAGIMLGPSILGRFAPELSAFLLPQGVAPFLSVLAQVGVILFMFLVGLELDTGILRKKTHATLAISHASIVLPFILGSTLALWLYPRFSSSDVPFSTFAMFMGVSMSVTAFPVLARILTDRRLHKTRIGIIAISCAAVDDVTAWCLLAFVVSVAQAKVDGALVTIALSLAYIVLMFAVVRPIARKVVRQLDHRGPMSQGAATVVFVALLLSALATEAIGVHAVFGAFFLGAVVPHDSRLVEDLKHKLEDLVIVLFLPAFFAFTGLRTQIGLVSGADEWMWCGIVILVASLGKFGGSTIAARLSGLSWRDASALGILMNTRGLMELIVLNIGLDLRVISPKLFAMMVIMALVTTIATTPILDLLSRGGALEEPEGVTARG